MGSIGTAFAIHADIPSESQAVVAKGATQVTLGGELRFRGWSSQNLNQTNFVPADTSTASWYDSRVRLSIQADVSKNTTSLIQLESSTGIAGGVNQTSDTYGWGTLNQKPNAALTILQAWIQHQGSGLLGIPAGIKVGHMPLALGQRQFLDHTKFGDDAIVFFMDPTKEMHIALLTTKFNEGSIQYNGDDVNGYVALMTYNLDNSNTVGLNYSYVSAGNTVATLASTDDGVNFQNLGLHASGKVSGVTYEAEFDTQFGKYFKGVAAEQKFRGYGIFANAAYTFAPVTIRAGFAYGSGDNDTTDGKNKEFQTTMGRDLHYAFIYEYSLRTSATGQALDSSHSGAGGRSTGIANTTYYRLGADYRPMKNLTTSLDGFIIRASKTPSGQSKSIGEEVDLKAAYQIDTNLTYSVIAGYFNTGSFYTTGAAPFNSADKKDVTQVMHALTLSF